MNGVLFFRKIQLAGVLRHRLRPPVNSFGSFTYSKSQIDGVAKYILNQPEHRAFAEAATRRQVTKKEHLKKNIYPY
jgi:hypothetical protein